MGSARTVATALNDFWPCTIQPAAGPLLTEPNGPPSPVESDRMKTDRYEMTTQAEVRGGFWAAHSSLRDKYYRASLRQNDYPADVRAAFVAYVDMLARDGSISESLASRVTL